VLANQLFMDLQTAGDDYGNPNVGGVSQGGEITAYVVTQDAPNDQTPIFPGRFVIRVPNHELVVENTSPQFLFETTQIWLDQQDVSGKVLQVHLDVDAVNNNVQGYITLYKPHLLAADEIATITLL